MKKIKLSILFIIGLLVFIPLFIDTLYSNIIDSESSPHQTNEEIMNIGIVWRNQEHAPSKKQRKTINHAANYFHTTQTGQNAQYLIGEQYFNFIDIYERSSDQANVTEDNKCDGLLNYEFDKNNIVALLGPITSDCTERFLKTNRTIPIITSFATRPDIGIDDQGKPISNFFRTVPNDKNRGKVMIEKWQAAHRAPSSSQNNDITIVLYDENNSFSAFLKNQISENIDRNSGRFKYLKSGELLDEQLWDSKIESVFIVDEVVNVVSNVQQINRLSDRAIYYVISETNDINGINTPGSKIFSTPTFASYAPHNAYEFINIPAKEFQNYASSTFIAFELLKNGIESTSNKVSSSCRENEKQSLEIWRCALIEYMKRGVFSELLGYRALITNNGEISNSFIDSETSVVNKIFKIERNNTQAKTIHISQIEEDYVEWLGRPIVLAIEASKKSNDVRIEVNYIPPKWVPGFIQGQLKKLFTQSKILDLNSMDTETISFYPYFIGQHTIELPGSSRDFRLTSGTVKIDVSPPNSLILIIILGLIFAALIKLVETDQVSIDQKTFIEVVLSAVFLHLLTVTVHHLEIPLLPAFSFSENTFTNTFYCGVIAGTIRLEIISYFITPIIMRFKKKDDKKIAS